MYNAILSRSTVFEFKPVPAGEAEKAIERAVRALEAQNGVAAKAEDGVLSYIDWACGGDIRKAMNAVELLFSASPRKDGAVTLTLGREANHPALCHAL